MRKMVPVLATAFALSISTLSQSVVAQIAMSDGQVQKIDEGAGKITLKHGPMKDLNMDMPMTMVYPVQDPSLLKGLKVGDKVKFQMERVNGQITVTKLQK